MVTVAFDFLSRTFSGSVRMSKISSGIASANCAPTVVIPSASASVRSSAWLMRKTLLAVMTAFAPTVMSVSLER
jgi:hypothetical protein